MSRIPQDTIDRIRESADIYDVVSRHVDLKKRGRNFFGLCPFHHEKTPSFSVAPDKGIYHCFGCGAGGNAINFIMEFDKISFVEAISDLGKQLGISVKMVGGDESKEFFTHLYDIHRVATELYHRTLFSARGKNALAYLKDRGIKEESLKLFKVGFAPDSHEFLVNNTQDKNYPWDVLEKSGLFGKSERGVFDRFRSRIMFPIFNPSGKPIAFGGRIFESDDSAKYMNSPETPLYHKSDVFYGLHLSRDAIRKAGFGVLVEGYTDVIQLYQAGIKNIVAVSGTAFTDRHAQQIRKFTGKIILAYDGDDAGKNAAIRAGYALLKGAVESKILGMPDGLDPDEWVNRDGAKVFEKGFNSASPLLHFHLKTKNVENLPSPERSVFVKEILNEILAITDPIIQGDLLKTLASELKIGDTEIVKLFKQQARKKFRHPSETTKEKEPDLFTSLISRAELGIVKVLLSSNKQAKDFIRENLNPENIKSDVLKSLIKELFKTEEPNFSELAGQVESVEERDFLTKIFMEEDSLSDPQQMAMDCLKTLNRVPLKDQIKAARVKIRELESAGKDATDYILKVAELQHQLKVNQ